MLYVTGVFLLVTFIGAIGNVSSAGASGSSNNSTFCKEYRSETSINGGTKAGLKLFVAEAKTLEVVAPSSIKGNIKKMVKDVQAWIKGIDEYGSKNALTKSQATAITNLANKLGSETAAVCPKK